MFDKISETRIVCCGCGKDYSPVLYEAENTNKPVLVCPCCGLKHLIDIIPIIEDIEVRPDALHSVRAGGEDYAVVIGSRILDKDRVDQSGNDDADVTNWDINDEFILAVSFGLDKKDTAAVQYKLRWRDVTDDDSFTDVESTGEISYTTTETVLSDGTAVTSSTRRCTDQSSIMTWQNGLESENDKLCPDGGTFDLGSDCWSEFQWALDCSGATVSHKYEFELYDDTNGASRGTCGSTISMYQGVLQSVEDVAAYFVTAEGIPIPVYQFLI